MEEMKTGVPLELKQCSLGFQGERDGLGLKKKKRGRGKDSPKDRRKVKRGEGGVPRKVGGLRSTRYQCPRRQPDLQRLG